MEVRRLRRKRTRQSDGCDKGLPKTREEVPRWVCDNYGAAWGLTPENAITPDYSESGVVGNLKKHRNRHGGMPRIPGLLVAFRTANWIIGKDADFKVEKGKKEPNDQWKRGNDIPAEHLWKPRITLLVNRSRTAQNLKPKISKTRYFARQGKMLPRAEESAHQVFVSILLVESELPIEACEYLAWWAGFADHSPTSNSIRALRKVIKHRFLRSA